LSILLEKRSTHSLQETVYHPQRQVTVTTKSKPTVSASNTAILSTAHGGVKHPWSSEWHHDQTYRSSPSDTYQQPSRPGPPRPSREPFFFKLIRKIWPVKHF
jgi:hypothetical protein